jgi:uncharacterized protein YegJ (DUF2314 family)
MTSHSDEGGEVGMADKAKKKAVHAAGILWLEGEDPEMVAAIAEAQRTFGQYRKELRREARRAKPVLDDAAVKVFFPSPNAPRAGEHLWVNEVQFGDEEMQGTLRNDASWLPGLREGARVSFTADRVSDWFFVTNGVVHGGFTVKVVLRHLTPEQFATYQDGSPACYFVTWYREQQAIRTP